ncbi:MAG: hypothetical protein CLLPBCKN_004096 [Chroococcidiopsis cubana SAG 39.79]|nr:hypothetical protein [Chroococcidiopsis cubana SAG 39.79]
MLKSLTWELQSIHLQIQQLSTLQIDAMPLVDRNLLQ